MIEIEAHAYPAERSRGARERDLFSNPLGTRKDLIVGEIAGEIVCQALVFPLVTFFGGRPVPTAGIASVGVAAEARGRGYASAMMEYIHSRQEKAKQPLTMLYAFRQGFYARLGYAPASSRKRLSIDARSIPKSWGASKENDIRPARGKDRKAIERLHTEVARARSGVHLRPAAWWDAFFARESRVLFVAPVKADLHGYIAFSLEQSELHGETTIIVDELVARTSAAQRALLGALGRMRDQVTTIDYEIAEDDPLERALVDPDGRSFGTALVEHALGTIVGGPMVRIGDLDAALAARGYLQDGAFTVDVEGTTREVHVENGQAKVRNVAKARAASSAKPSASAALPRLRTDRRTLAAVLYGGLAVDDAVALGLAEADSDVDPILRLPAVAPFDVF